MSVKARGSTYGLRRWCIYVLVGGLIAASVSVSGCGSSSSTSSNASPGTSGGSSSGSNSNSDPSLAEARAKVTKAEAPIKFQAPSSFDMSKNKGKTVWVIAPSTQIPFAVMEANGVKQAGAAAGINVKVFDGQGEADLFNQGVSTAISQHAAGIILFAISPQVVSGPLKQAKAANIPVIDNFNRDPNDPLDPGIDAQVTLDYSQSGRTMADFIAADSNGKGTVAVLTWGIFKIFQEMVPAFEQELHAVCPGCTVKTVKNVSPTAPATQLQSITTTLIQQYPTLNYLVPVSDNLATGMVPAIQASGRSVKLVSVDGDTGNLDNVRKGNVEVADVADPPVASIGWALMDQMGRLMAHLPPSKADANLQTQLFTTASIPATDQKLFPGYAAYEDGYLRAWGLK